MHSFECGGSHTYRVILMGVRVNVERKNIFSLKSFTLFFHFETLKRKICFYYGTDCEKTQLFFTAQKHDGV